MKRGGGVGGARGVWSDSRCSSPGGRSATSNGGGSYRDSRMADSASRWSSDGSSGGGACGVSGVWQMEIGTPAMLLAAMIGGVKELSQWQCRIQARGSARTIPHTQEASTCCTQFLCARTSAHLSAPIDHPTSFTGFKREMLRKYTVMKHDRQAEQVDASSSLLPEGCLPGGRIWLLHHARRPFTAR